MPVATFKRTIPSLSAASMGLLALALIVVTAGCSEDISSAPPIELPFTLFGVVNPTADTQAVIVYPVTSGILEPIGLQPLDAVVTSRELGSDDVRVWRDSVVHDGQGSYSHIYWSDFRAEFGRTYALDVRRSDGEVTRVDVRVPLQVHVETSDDGTERMQVGFRGAAFRLVKLEIAYELGIAVAPPATCPDAPRWFRYSFSYAGREEATADGWNLEVDLSEYVRFMELLAIQDTGNDQLFAERRTRLALIRIHLQVTIGDESWDVPDGFLDQRILSHPGTLTNVANGLGFVGAGYRYDLSLFPSSEAIDEAHFYDYLTGRELCDDVTGVR